MQFRIVLLLATLCLPISALAQQGTSQKANPAAQESSLQQLVTKQFGPDFTVDPHFQPMYGDFDGDHTQDMVVIAFSKHPLGGSGAFKYKVSDPYDGYFGMGDPKITTAFANFGDGSGHCILVIHNWKAASPRAKWVIVNVPFNKLSLGQVTYKKKTVAAVATSASDGLNSIVFFDGHKYRWEPNNFADDAEN